VHFFVAELVSIAVMTYCHIRPYVRHYIQ